VIRAILPEGASLVALLVAHRRQAGTIDPAARPSFRAKSRFAPRFGRFSKPA
jgi:hypothetical protein